MRYQRWSNESRARRKFSVALLVRLVMIAALLMPSLPGCTSFQKTARKTKPGSSIEFASKNSDVLPPSPRRASDIELTSAKDEYDEPVDSPSHAAVPGTVRTRLNDQLWKITLSQAIDLALKNNPIIRQNGTLLSPNNPLLRNADQTSSIFDTQLQATEVQFQNRGYQAARADFDPQITGNLIWGDDAKVQNSGVLSGGLQPGSTLTQDTASFLTRMEKQNYYGGTFAVYQSWDYSGTNQSKSVLLFPSTYTGVLGAEYKQPLWAGSGYDYTDIAGPINFRSRGFTQLNQGRRIAQLNERMSGIDFELAVLNLIKDVCDSYWGLYQSFQEYEAELAYRDAALQVWQEVRANIRGTGAAAEAQAELTFQESVVRTKTELAAVYEAETKFRRLLGLPVADGKLLRPTVIPLTDYEPAPWDVALNEAYQSRQELTRQKMQLQSLEWQLQAAKSLLNPRLDFTSSYRVNGFGDQLIAKNHSDGVTQEGYNSAYGTLFDWKQTGWNLGFNFSSPIYFRTEQTQVRNLELRLAKTRMAMVAAENEISHELSLAYQNIAKWGVLLEGNARRKAAAERLMENLDAQYRAGGADRNIVDQLLRARQSVVQTSIEYSRAVTAFNQSILEFQYRQGRLLNDHNLSIQHFRDPTPTEVPPVPPSEEAPDPKPEPGKAPIPPIPPPPMKSQKVAEAVFEFKPHDPPWMERETPELIPPSPSLKETGFAIHPDRVEERFRD